MSQKLKLGKKIGEGGMGKVYLSTYLVDPKTGETIKSATKTVPQNKMNMEEVALQASLSKIPDCNAHIACFYDLFQNPKNNAYYIVMEHIAGDELWDYLRNQRRELNAEQLHNLFVDALEGLAFIHANDIAHGDIKLENLMYDHEARKLKYIDFGFGCVAEKCAANPWHGTPFLFPPEAYKRSKVTKRPKSVSDMQRADLWALGAMLTELMVYKPGSLQRVDDLGMSGADVKAKPVNWKASNHLKGVGMKRSGKQFAPFYRVIDDMMRIDPNDRKSAAVVLRTFKKAMKK